MTISNPEDIFRQLRSIEKRRELGQFFTPDAPATLMAEWLADGDTNTLLDPSCGPGALLRAAVKAFPHTSSMTAFDIDNDALQLAQRFMPGNHDVSFRCQNFLTSYPEKFDSIIANPPYIKHTFANVTDEIFDELGSAFNIRIARTCNIYMLFLLKCLLCLKPQGRMCFLIPSEWSNANFSRNIRQMLLERRLLHRMVYYSNNSNVFSDALTTACVLFIGEGGGPHVPVHVITDSEHAEISSLNELETKVPAKLFSLEKLSAADNWNTLFRSQKAAPEGYVKLGSLAHVRRGIVTGANSFFHLSSAQVEYHGLSPQSITPCVGRCTTGMKFSPEHLTELQAKGKSWLLTLGDNPTVQERHYIAQGEEQGLHKRYILSRRKPWYSMEQVRAAPIWAGVFSRKRIKFVLNTSGARNLTTWHGIYPHNNDPVFHAALVSVLNSDVVMQLAAERSRGYGGGLLKFEPSDLFGIPVPDISSLSGVALESLALLCDNKNKEEHDKLVLKTLNSQKFKKTF